MLTPSAMAIRNPDTVLESHKGWVYVGGRTDVPSSGYHPQYYIAWRYNASSANHWSSSYRRFGTRVYAWPYGSGWSWTWTSADGWKAMRTSDLRTGYYCAGPSCPMF